MRACGIVAEYNPFHNGHAYQLKKAKELSGADVMIVVMSGNFLQRGEPALVDKWTRARMALENGADLVIELPVAFSVQPADLFAEGAVALLKEIKCQAISFGAEAGTGEDFNDAGEIYWRKKKEIDHAFSQLVQGESYPRKMQKSLEHALGSIPIDLSKPNNTLGFAYAKANVRDGQPMALYPVVRKSAQYLDEELGANHFSSATAIRKVLLEGTNLSQSLQKIQPFVPRSTVDNLNGKQWSSWEHLWPFLQYQLTVQDLESLNAVYQMTEGIEHRLVDKARQSRSMYDFLEQVKTKRQTWAKLQRLSVYTLLQLSKEKVQAEIEKGPKGIRLLGFTEVGKTYLHAKKKEISLPVLSNITRLNKKMWEMDIKAGEVYRLVSPESLPHQDFYTFPLHIRS